MVRQLRVTTARLEALCAEVPYSVFSYLTQKYATIIEKQVGKVQNDFDEDKVIDDSAKAENLRQFRPNLANPANKEVTRDLDGDEVQRCERFFELIDDTQINLLDIE